MWDHIFKAISMPYEKKNQDLKIFFLFVFPAVLVVFL